MVQKNERSEPHEQQEGLHHFERSTIICHLSSVILKATHCQLSTSLITFASQLIPMGLLNQQGKKGDKKSGSKQKNTSQQSKFITSKGASKPAAGGQAKKMT